MPRKEMARVDRQRGGRPAISPKSPRTETFYQERITLEQLAPVHAEVPVSRLNETREFSWIEVLFTPFAWSRPKIGRTVKELRRKLGNADDHSPTALEPRESPRETPREVAEYQEHMVRLEVARAQIWFPAKSVLTAGTSTGQLSYRFVARYVGN